MIRLKIHYTAIGLLLAIFSLFAFSFCSRSVSGASDAPVNVHLTWQRSNMSSTMTVTWQTTYSNSGSIVAYDEISRDGNLSLYRYSVNGSTHTYVGASGWLHDAELIGLKPNSTYYFVCGGEIGGYSPERSFKTAPIGPSNLRFVVGGDCRSNPVQRDLISSAMREFNPSFVLFGGDFVDSGYNQTQWDDFLGSLNLLWIGSNGLSIPIVPCLGNHEENATNYFEQFALPGNEQWYSLDWGELVHLVVLNSEADPSGEQLAWLENDLASHENFAWKFAIFHRPPFSSSNHGSWTEGQQYWCPIFDRYHVNIVFSGHDHDYERSKPINYTASKTSPQDSYSNGTMYIVSGGWGAPLHPSGWNWWTDYSLSVYHFVLVDIYANGTLCFQAKDASGLTFDAVQETPLIPEYTSLIILPLSMIATLMAACARKKRSFARDTSTGLQFKN